MIITFDDLAIKYKDYTDIKGRIRRDIQAGVLTQVTRGVYESDAHTDGKYLAGVIYGPSYLSFDFALSHYSLIPEMVYNTYTSATFDKGKVKRYENAFGFYTYRDIPKAVYNLGVNIVEENGYSYQIATAEKALCDKLYTLQPVKNKSELSILLFNDLRIDKGLFDNLNKDDFMLLAPLYKSTNLKILMKIINGRGNKNA